MKLTNLSKRTMLIVSFTLLVMVILFSHYRRDDITSTQMGDICSSSRKSDFKITPKIHQYVPNKKMTNDMKKLTETWSKLNPDYDVIIHDDLDIDNYFTNSLNKSTFYNLKSKEEKLAFFKYSYIHENGGIWAEHNLRCIEPVPIEPNTDVMITLDENYYNQFMLTDNFFAFAPKSEILGGLINSIKRTKKIEPTTFSDHYNNYFKINMITNYNIVINENYPDYSISAIPMFLMGNRQRKILNNNNTIVKTPSFNYDKHINQIIQA